MSCYIKLRGYLADLYPKEDEARLLGRDAHVEIARVNFQGAALTFWNNLLEQANYEKKLEKLLERIEEDKPPQELIELIKKFAIEVKSGSFSRIPYRHRTNAPTATLDQVKKLIAERTRQFFGRDDQLLVLDRFVSEKDRGVMIVTAPGGFGKSALLANWALRQECRGALVAQHFFNGTMHRTVQPTDALKGLLYQIAVLRDVEPTDASDDLSRLEDQLTTELCKDASTDAPLIVVLDGLDEAAKLIEPIVPAGLGKHVYIVASGRAEDSESPRHIASWLYAKNTVGYLVQRFPLKALNITGVMEWLRERAPGLNENANGIAQRLLATSEGIPLFLRFIVDDIRQQLDKGIAAKDLERRLVALPAPFTDYAAERLEAMRKLHGSPAAWLDVQRIFALLTLIRGAMPLSEIAAVSGAQSDVMALDTSITRWFTFRLGDTEGSVAFLHPRLAEVFHDALARSPLTQGLVYQVERRLIEHCAAWQKNDSLYGLTYLPWHLLRAGRAKQALEALTSIGFLTARVGHPPPRHAQELTAQTLTDFTALSEKAPADLRSVAKSWLGFWATIEPSLSAVLLGPRAEDAKLLLPQLLADTLGPPGQAISERSKISWRQLTGQRAPSNLLRTLVGHTHWVAGALALSDGRLLSWSFDTTLRLWSPDGGPLGELKGHTRLVVGALALSDGRLLSWSIDETLRLWSPDGAPLRELKGHTDSVAGALALTDGRLLSWCRDGTLRLWSPDGAPLEPWLWPYGGLQKVFPHTTRRGQFWVLAANDVILVRHYETTPAPR
jgi:WD40 repeat protein